MSNRALRLQNVLTFYQEEGWYIDRKDFCCSVSLYPVPKHSEILNTFAIVPEERAIDFYFCSQVSHLFNTYAQSFLGHLYSRLEAQGMTLEMKGQRSFEIMWRLTPTWFDTEDVDDFKNQLDARLAGGERLVFLSLHALKMCERCATRPWKEAKKNLNPKTLVDFVVESESCHLLN